MASLRCLGTDRSYAVGTLTLPSLAELRSRASEVSWPGRLRLSIAEGDVRAMHGKPENRGALFQVASQFNMLEMVGPHVTPEDGVTRYEYDRTQGPACAMAAGAALDLSQLSRSGRRAHRPDVRQAAGRLGRRRHRVGRAPQRRRRRRGDFGLCAMATRCPRREGCGTSPST